MSIIETLRWFEKEILYIAGSERDLQNLRERMEAMEREKDKILKAIHDY